MRVEQGRIIIASGRVDRGRIVRFGNMGLGNGASLKEILVAALATIDSPDDTLVWVERAGSPAGRKEESLHLAC